jgi:PAS domain S-box-containing protein
MIAPPEASAILCDMASPTNAGVNLWAAAERFMSREGDGGEEALSSRKQELRLLVEVIPALVGQSGPEGNVEFAAQLRATLNVIPAYTWYTAPSGGLTFVNKRTADYLGLPEDHPLRFGIDIGAPWDAHIPLLHPDDREESRKTWSTCLRRGEAAEFSQRVPNAQGVYRLFLSRAEPLRASDGTLLQWIGVNLDIEELKCTEQALRESEGKFRDYAETASDWFWEIGPDHKFTLLTENAFGSDPSNRIGTACWDHALDLETEPEKWRLVRATLDSRKPFRDFVYCVLGGSGSPMYVKASGKPVFEADGQFRGYRGTGTDVTALIRAQEEHERLRQLESDLAHMNRLSMMGELAASLAHEIAQPIATARNNARASIHFLDRSPPDLGQVREALTCVVDDADRAGDILDRIRDHIKKVPPRKERFDLNHAITDVIALAQSAIVKNGVSIKTRLTEGLSDVQADRVQLHQVVLNLILNAIEAMGTIEEGVRELSIITKQHEAGGVLVAVHDSGPGIDPERLDRVFDAFYTTKSSGVGMGLSICRSIIHAHGGRLWADVNTPRGAVFRLTLPGADNELTNSSRPARLTREPYEDTVSDTAHRPAYEGNKRHHRSGRGRVPRRRGKQ